MSEAERRSVEPGRPLVAPERSPVAIFTTEMIRRANPFHHAELLRAHLVIVPTAGVAKHTVDFRQHEAPVGSAIHVQPGQVQQFDLGAKYAASVLLVESEAVEPGLFDPIQPVPVVELGDATPIVTAVALDLAREQQSPNFAPGVLRAAAGLILHHVARAATATGSGFGLRAGLDARPVPGPRSPHEELLRAFKVRVEQTFATTRSVSTYAQAVGTSTKTLSRVTMSLTGLSPKEIIDQRVTLEAKRLLVDSSTPIASIGTVLGFTEATNFTKYFVRTTGLTPYEFRDQRLP